MRKMPTLFKRTFKEDHTVKIHNEVTLGCEWVLHGEGVATEKVDGACCAIFNGEFWRRYDAKQGKPIPKGAVLCQEKSDAVTGHLPCWVPVDVRNAADKWFVTAFVNSGVRLTDEGTYEAVGPHFQNNVYGLQQDTLCKHGAIVLHDLQDRSFEGIKEYLQNHYIEGIVFHRGNGEMCKIKRSDFGFSWKNVKHNSKGR